MALNGERLAANVDRAAVLVGSDDEVDVDIAPAVQQLPRSTQRTERTDAGRCDAHPPRIAHKRGADAIDDGRGRRARRRQPLEQATGALLDPLGWLHELAGSHRVTNIIEPRVAVLKVHRA